MIVTFNPYAGSAADANGAYMNFLRCITAAATAAAGTTSLTVNPITGITGASDNTKNCIISIDANTDAGGWQTSTSHNVTAPGTAFTAIATNSLYRADFYVSSGKSTYPYNKVTFHITANTVRTPHTSTSALGFNIATNPFISITTGCSATSDYTSTSYKQTTTAGSYPTGGTQTTGYTFNNSAWNSANYLIPSFMLVYNPAVNYKIAVTQNYMMVWEVAPNNSYANGYSNTLGSAAFQSYVSPHWTYGTLFYTGLRETQAWENSLNYNNNWAAFMVQHVTTRDNSGSTGNTTSTLNARNEAAAFMATMSNAGVPTSTASVIASISSATNNQDPVTAPYAYNTNIGYAQTGSDDNVGYWTTVTVGQPVNNLNMLFQSRSRASTITSGFSWGPNYSLIYMPTVDPNTGSLVPPAVPIVFKRTRSDSWTPGGAVTGIYKSLNAPLSTMKLYWTAENQTFTVNGESYIPLVFNEDMYLIRNA
jgi:hypothetical protein